MRKEVSPGQSLAGGYFLGFELSKTP